jgi:hypothetical protein
MRQLAGTTTRIPQRQLLDSGACRSNGAERRALANVAITLRRDEPGLSHVTMVKPVGWSIASLIYFDWEATMVC